jgi:hypothetical protein
MDGRSPFWARQASGLQHQPQKLSIIQEYIHVLEREPALSGRPLMIDRADPTWPAEPPAEHHFDEAQCLGSPSGSSTPQRGLDTCEPLAVPTYSTVRAFRPQRTRVRIRG